MPSVISALRLSRRIRRLMARLVRARAESLVAVMSPSAMAVAIAEATRGASAAQAPRRGRNAVQNYVAGCRGGGMPQAPPSRATVGKETLAATLTSSGPAELADGRKH